MPTEGVPNEEASERAVLVEVLRAKGFEDFEARELLINWSERKELEAFDDGSLEARVRLELDRARLYAEVGTPIAMAAAIRSFDNAAYDAEGARAAFQDNNADLQGEMEILSSLEESANSEYDAYLKKIDEGYPDEKGFEVWENIIQQLAMDQDSLPKAIHFLNGLRYRAIRLKHADKLEEYTRLVNELGGEVEE